MGDIGSRQVRYEVLPAAGSLTEPGGAASVDTEPVVSEPVVSEPVDTELLDRRGLPEHRESLAAGTAPTRR